MSETSETRNQLSTKRLVIGVVSVAVSAGLVVFLLSRLDLNEVTVLLAEADRRWLVFAALLTFTMPFSAVLRWRGVLRTISTLKLSYSTSLRAVLMANVLNSFLPSKAGDIAKAAYLRRQGGVTQGLGTVLLERLVDLAILGLLALLGALISGVLWGYLAGAMLLGGVAFIFSLVLLVPIEKLPLPAKLKSILSTLRDVFKPWLRNSRAVGQTILGSFLTWSAGGLTVYALAAALPGSVGMGYVYGIFPLAILAGLLPLTVSGIGTRDAAFTALLGSQVGTEEATLIGLGYTLYAYWLLSVVSLPVVLWEMLRMSRTRSGKISEGG